GLGYFFTVVCQNSEKNNLNISSEYIDLHYFDPTSTARLENIIRKDFKQDFIYMQDDFETKKSYEAFGHFIQNLENLPIALKIDKIKLYNTQGLKLKLDLMFKFVNL
ncbi:hypothetical protein ACISNT_03790, partial [Campylobacter jejuni]